MGTFKEEVDLTRYYANVALIESPCETCERQYCPMGACGAWDEWFHIAWRSLRVIFDQEDVFVNRKPRPNTKLDGTPYKSPKKKVRTKEEELEKARKIMYAEHSRKMKAYWAEQRRQGNAKKKTRAKRGKREVETRKGGDDNGL